jgi:surfactin synthase thioesterase subunit
MVQHAYQEVTAAPAGGRTLFYGHCLGAIVAYEVALRLEREGRQAPDHLLVAGVVGPHLYVAPDAHKLPVEKLLELLGVLKYPLARRLRDDPGFRDERLGTIRADLEAMASYQYRPAAPLSLPITVISLWHDRSLRSRCGTTCGATLCAPTPGRSTPRTGATSSSGRAITTPASGHQGRSTS